METIFQAVSQYLGNTVKGGWGGGPVCHGLLVVKKLEMDTRPSKGRTHNRITDVAHFGRICLEVLSPYRGVEKQTIHRDHRPFRGSDLGYFPDRSTLNHDPGAHGCRFCSGDDLHV